MKTPDEIKRGLGRCAPDGGCHVCPYWQEPDGKCIPGLHRDALAYIQQLERERDAAVYYIATKKECKTCKHFSHKASDEPCRSCGIGQSRWEWRGVEEDDE